MREKLPEGIFEGVMLNPEVTYTEKRGFFSSVFSLEGKVKDLLKISNRLSRG